uniref:MATH domain-containing protein n=1 Tax=Ascaris lumbricoides TaxID=6252 RepID=A0A9J2P4V6_ASCLU
MIEKINMATPPYCEGLLSLPIADFVFLKEPIRGPCVEINGLSWRIKAIPKTYFGKKKTSMKCLSFHVECCQYPYSGTWSCKASAELRLKSQKEGVEDFVRRVDQVYTTKENDWGYACFATWNEITDESLGYIKNGVVILEAMIKAELPRKLQTLDQLRKKAEGYMALADMQYGRGLIDKAIEVNETASNFCRDNRICCLDEALRQQKQKLSDAKLVERIKAIEEGSQDEENVLDRKALKLAISALPKGAKRLKFPSFRYWDTALQALTMTELCEVESTRIRNSSYDSIYQQAKTGASGWNDEDSSAREQDENIRGSKLDGAGSSKKLMMGVKTSTVSSEHTQSPNSCLASNPESEKRLLREFADRRGVESGGDSRPLRSDCEIEQSHQPSAVDRSCQTVECLPVATGCQQYRESGKGEMMLLRCLEERDALMQEVAASASHAKPSAKKCTGFFGSVFDLFDVVKERCSVDEIKKVLGKLAVAAESIGNTRAGRVPEAKEVGRNGARTKAEVLCSFLENAEVEQLLREISGISRTPKETPYFETICSALKKGIVVGPAEAERIVEHVDKVAVRAEKLKNEKEDLEKQLAGIQEKISKYAFFCYGWFVYPSVITGTWAPSLSSDSFAHCIQKEAQDRRELQEKVDSLKKNIRKTEQKYASEMGKLRKDLLVSRELEKEAVKESRTEGAQLVPTKNQLNESSLELQRLKKALIAQMMGCNNKVVLVMECARKAEVRLLQLKLEIGLDILKHTYEDSERNISELQLKREQIARGRYYELMEGSIAAWHDGQRLIRKLIVSAENDFAVQVDQIKGGKQLASLPAISVTKPPPALESFPFDDTYMQVPSALEHCSPFAVTESPSCDAQEMSATACSSASDKRMLKGATTLSDIPSPCYGCILAKTGSMWSRTEDLRIQIAIIAAQLFLQMTVEPIMVTRRSLLMNWAVKTVAIHGHTRMGAAAVIMCGLINDQDFADNTMGPSSHHGDEILRHLRMHFPALSCENWMEYLKELMIRNGCNSLDGMTVRDVVTGVTHLIVEKHA